MVGSGHMFGGQVICWGVRSYVGGSGHIMFWSDNMLGGQLIC